MASPNGGWSKAVIKGKPQTYQGRPLQTPEEASGLYGGKQYSYDEYGARIGSAKAAAAGGSAIAGGLLIPLAVGATAAGAINSYGKKINKDIGDIGDKAAAQNLKSSKDLKKALLARKKAKLDAQKNDKPMTKSPKGIGVGWGP
jgi:hypothetical protein